MSEKLSFDWFIAKIHEVFDRLPDYRRFSPNLRYSIKDAALGAFALFFAQGDYVTDSRYRTETLLQVTSSCHAAFFSALPGKW